METGYKFLLKFQNENQHNCTVKQAEKYQDGTRCLVASVKDMKGGKGRVVVLKEKEVDETGRIGELEEVFRRDETHYLVYSQQKQSQFLLGLLFSHKIEV